MAQRAFWCLLCSMICTAGVVADDAPMGQRAFPGAEGFGAYASGGRGGKVLFVTHLKDYHPAKEKPIPGSLRAACRAEGPRIVVFRVSGTLPLKTTLAIRKPHITIAGQSAPGGGICLKDYPLSISADNVIVRYLRVRPGHGSGKGVDSISVTGGKNIILDHCSASWSVDETLSVTRNAGGPPEPSPDNVTVQWCMITESLNKSVHPKGRHSCGSLLRGSYGAKYSFHHSLYAHHNGRSPRPGNYIDHKTDPKGLLFDFRNNVIYNWGSYAGRNLDADSITRMNFIGNTYVTGPSSARDVAFLQYCSYGAAHFHDNWMNGKCPEDPWSLVAFLPFAASLKKRYDRFRDAREWTEETQRAFKQSEPLPVAPVTTSDAATAYQQVLEKAGASLPARDAVDARMVNDVKNRTGRIIDDELTVGGWPTLASTPAPPDTDKDGMPDAWETAHGLNPNDPSDASGDTDRDGYTHIEEWLNRTDPQRKDG